MLSCTASATSPDATDASVNYPASIRSSSRPEGGGVRGAHLRDLWRRNYSRSTIYQRGRALTRLQRFLGVVPIERAGTSVLVEYLDRLAHPATRGAERAHLAGFYRWLVLEELREDDPTIRVPRPRAKRRLPHPIGEDRLREALALAPERVKPWLYLAAYAGLRACEVAGLRGEDLWWHVDPVLIVVRHGKGDDPGAVPVAPVLEKVLRPFPTRGWLFLKQDGSGEPVRPHLVSHHANDYLHSLGIWETFHSLRHRFGTQALRASGGNLRQVQELMRHRSIVSTTLYTEIDKSEVASIVAALPE